jgi:hypothetical protein
VTQWLHARGHPARRAQDVLLTHPQVMRGYWNKPEASAVGATKILRQRSRNLG